VESLPKSVGQESLRTSLNALVGDQSHGKEEFLPCSTVHLDYSQAVKPSEVVSLQIVSGFSVKGVSKVGEQGGRLPVEEKDTSGSVGRALNSAVGTKPRTAHKRKYIREKLTVLRWWSGTMCPCQKWRA